MEQSKRNEIIASEIEIAKKHLAHNPWFSGAHVASDIFKLSNGRTAQIKLTVTIDKDEFTTPTKTFNSTAL